jgi:hypothetical protein
MFDHAPISTIRLETHGDRNIISFGNRVDVTGIVLSVK